MRKLSQIWLAGAFLFALAFCFFSISDLFSLPDEGETILCRDVFPYSCPRGSCMNLGGWVGMDCVIKNCTSISYPTGPSWYMCVIPEN